MSDYNRPAKPVSGDGGTSYVDGNELPAAELNDEFDAIQSVINGGIDETNFSGSIQIPNADLVDIAMSKVLDLADDAATYKGTVTPGDSASPSLPSSLAAEMTRLRYRIGANNRYWSSVLYMDASAVATTASWIEPPIIGPNLLPNPGFELHSAGTPNAPDGWTLVGTPSTVAIDNPAHTGTGLEKRSLNIVTDAANEGISVAIAGLKTGVKYLVGMSYSITNNGTVAGTVNLTTTNGLASGAYQNLALTDGIEASSTISVLQGIVKPTATPNTMTITISATQSGADWNIHSVWMYELADGIPFDLPGIPMQTARDVTAATYPTSGWTGSGSAWREETLTSLSLSQYVPFRGYRFVYEVSVPYSSVDSTAAREAARVYIAIQQNIDGGVATTVAGPVLMEIRSAASDMRDSGFLTLRHVVENPTPGSTYAFTTLLGVYDDTDYEQVSIPPLVPSTGDSVQMAADARLIVERI